MPLAVTERGLKTLPSKWSSIIPRSALAASGFRIAQRVPMTLGGKNVSCVRSSASAGFFHETGM
jgi:hypothetical protein